VTAELNNHLEVSVSAKTDMGFTNPTSTVGLQWLNFKLLKVILRYVNGGVTTIKPGCQTTGSARDMVR
jgi:hypothetical protein